MRIAILCYASVGGSGVVATELAQALAARDHDVYVLSRERPFRWRFDSPRLSFVPVPMPDYPLFREPQYLLGLTNAITRLAKRYRLPVVSLERRNPKSIEQIHKLKPDLLCVASFPFRLPDEVISAAPLGAINAHPSLLPKHRGPDPLFWTYLDGDVESGVTIHWIDDGIDSGLVLVEGGRVPGCDDRARGRLG